MILDQHYLGCLSQASYLIGDEETSTAVVVDPRRDVDLYLEEAEKLGLTIRHVFLTHFHADYISGHLELRDRVGAKIHMGARSNADYPFVAMKDGDDLTFGGVKLVVWETPGHTPESICILVYDLKKDPKNPKAVLTGDTLFIGDVGRPDLMASQGVTAQELASDLYDSITQKLLTLPDETQVLPAHGAGSMCGKNLSSETVSTIGQQKQLNYALQKMDKAKFIELVTANQPTAPDYFAYDATLNRQERVTLDENLKKVLVPLSGADVIEKRNAGAQILDVRSPDRFAQRHLKGSLNIGLEGTYAVWAGSLLDRRRPVVVIAEPGAEGEAVLRLGRIGFDHVAGYLDGGIDALADRAQELATAARETPASLKERLAGPRPPVVLDVRTAAEREGKHLEDSLHVPLIELPSRLAEVPAGEVVVHCAGGYRSSMAACLLRNQGRTGVTDLAGGIQAWEQAGGKLLTPVGG